MLITQFLNVIKTIIFAPKYNKCEEKMGLKSFIITFLLFPLKFIIKIIGLLVFAIMLVIIFLGKLICKHGGIVAFLYGFFGIIAFVMFGINTEWNWAELWLNYVILIVVCGLTILSPMIISKFLDYLTLGTSYITAFSLSRPLFSSKFFKKLDS